ncbi:YopX family protein [Bacillus pretiosus]
MGRMREIKYKAYVKELNLVLPALSIQFDFKKVEVPATYSKHIDTEYFNFEQVELIQYTGEKDAHGNEIYEGDIVYQEFYDHRVETAHGLTGVVKQEEGVWWIDNEVDDAVRLWSELNLNHIKGNAFENPELLQGGKK